MLSNRDQPVSFASSAKELFLSGPLNILLLAIPFAIIGNYSGWPDLVTFLFSLLSLVPLAERLGFVTEQLALHTNETIGGLLNATFGNATELIVAVAALSKGLYRLVQLSLLGSVLSNMLLVLGTSFLFGGIRFKTQKFGKISSQINSSLLMLSTMGVLLPTALTLSGQESKMGELGFSRATSLVLFIMYCAFLFFQLYTHQDSYEAKDDDLDEKLSYKRVSNTEPATDEDSTLDATSNVIHSDADDDHDPDSSGVLKSSRLQISTIHRSGNADEAAPKKVEPALVDDDNSDDEEVDVLGFHYALLWLGIITVFIALLSEAISRTIEKAAEASNISGIFLSAIVLPIVGNAAEHSGAVMFAMKGKLDLALGVAIGSSTQIALMVLPLLVLIGWSSSHRMSLNFGVFESISLLLTVISVTFAIKDGTSNWLLGLSLIAAYVIIAVGFWAHDNELLS